MLVLAMQFSRERCSTSKADGKTNRAVVRRLVSGSDRGALPQNGTGGPTNEAVRHRRSEPEVYDRPGRMMKAE